MEFKRYILLIIFIVALVLDSISTISVEDIAENGNLNFTTIATKYGMNIEEYDIVTKDGYILKLFRIPGDIKRPVLLVHGIIDSAYTFVIRGKSSIQYNLAKSGYDVWLINLRGVTYSRRHVTLSPTDQKFWDFTYHENGYYDLPPTIDFILHTTGQNKLSAIGHSQGNTIFYVLGATRLEYNDKVKILVALAPVCYFNHLAPPLSDLVESGPILNELLIASNQEEIFPDSLYKVINDNVCKLPHVGYSLCSRVILAVAGEDHEEFSSDIYYAVIGHYPTSTSRRNALHIIQNAASKEFAYFDYGLEKNIKVYGKEIPPKYNLSKVTMNVALFAGKNDKLAPLKDVSRLRKSLPNVVEYRIMEREKFNHLDHVWGKHIQKYVIPHLLDVLNRFNK